MNTRDVLSIGAGFLAGIAGSSAAGTVYMQLSTALPTLHADKLNLFSNDFNNKPVKSIK